MVRHCVHAIIAAMALLSVPAGANAQENGQWLRAESANFIVYSDRGERELRRAVQGLEDFDTTLRFVTSSDIEPSPNKLEVFLLRNTRALRQVRPGISEDIRGFYTATPQQIAAFVIYSDVGSLDRTDILFHEYAHHFMLHYFPQTYPSWYIEGWAEFVSTFEIEGRNAIIGATSRARSWSVRFLGLLPVEQMLAPERVQGRSAEFDERFYATGWFATLYMHNHPERQAGMQNYIRALGEGDDPLAAFEPAFGIPAEQFDRELAAFMRGRIQTFAVTLPDAEAQMTISRLPLSADDLLLPLAHLRLGMGAPPGEENPGRLAGQIEAAAERFGDDTFALLASAHAASARGDCAAANARLARLMALRDSAEAHYLRASCAYSRAQAKDTPPQAAAEAMREARSDLVRAFAISPSHVPTLFLYAVSFVREGTSLTDQQLDVLARAVELAPQVNSMRLLLAHELMKANEFDTAVQVLRPIIYEPHDAQASGAARVLMDAARRREQLPIPIPPESSKPEGGEKQ